MDLMKINIAVLYHHKTKPCPFSNLRWARIFVTKNIKHIYHDYEKFLNLVRIGFTYWIPSWLYFYIFLANRSHLYDFCVIFDCTFLNFFFKNIHNRELLWFVGKSEWYIFNIISIGMDSDPNSYYIR